MNITPLIELQHLSLGYNGRPVLSDINLAIEKHDFICVVGPNGSGKSTLIKGILGLLKPLKGKVIYHNLKKNFIGYMPQETDVDPSFPASVYEIVLSGTLNQSGHRFFYNQKSKRLATDSLKTLKIESLKNRPFCDLSGGQRQKVLLARSLCATSKLLILDEPSNNLDSKSKRELYQTVVNLHRTSDITVMMITHDLDHDNLIGNKILSLRQGDFFFGPTKDFIRKVHHE